FLAEIQIDAVDRRERQRDLALDVVLRAHRVARAGHEFRRQTNVERLADLGPGAREPRVVLTIRAHHEVRDLMHHCIGLAQDFLRRKRSVCHCGSSQGCEWAGAAAVSSSLWSVAMLTPPFLVAESRSVLRRVTD